VGEGAADYKVQGHSAMSCAKTGRLILMIYTRVSWISRGMCLLGVRLIMLPIYGVTSQKRYILGVRIGICKQNTINTCITRNPAIAEGPRDAGVPVEIW